MTAAGIVESQVKTAEPETAAAASSLAPAAPHRLRHVWLGDLLICAAISLVCMAVVRLLYLRVVYLFHFYDVWFDADFARYYFGNLDPTYVGHDRSNVHPVQPLVMYPARWIAKLLHLTREQAIKTIIQVSAVLWCNSLYLALRMLGRPRGVAAIFTLMGFASGAGVYFLAVPETYSLGSATMLLCIAAFAAHQRGYIAGWWLVPAAAATLAITITNFMVGAVSLVLAFGLRKGTQAAINAFFIIAMLSVVQHLIVPRSVSFLQQRSEANYMCPTSPMWSKIEVFLGHGMVTPVPERKVVPGWPVVGLQKKGMEYMYFDHVRGCPVVGIRLQDRTIFDHTLVGGLALALWLAILGTGIVQAWTHRPIAKTDVLVSACILGQLGLHLIYGPETFLYTLNFVPLLILMASGAACRSRVFLVLSVVLLGLVCWNNYWSFTQAVDSLDPVIPRLQPPDIDWYE